MVNEMVVMTKRKYTVLAGIVVILLVFGYLVIAGTLFVPKNEEVTQAPDFVSMPGVLVETFNISGDGLKGLEVNETWRMVGVLVIFDPSTVSKDSYVRLYDPHVFLQQDFGVTYSNVPRGTTYKSGVTINLETPMNGPYGKWIIMYSLPNNADVTVQIYKTPLNDTS